MSAIARYTQFVALSKRFLWLLVVAMIGVLVWIAQYNTGENGARLVFSHIEKSAALQNVMTQPYYQGIDTHNRPYTVIADKATQIDAANVAMDGIRADMMLGENDWVALNARTGRLNPQTKQMELGGGVELFHDAGYGFRTDHAHIDIEKGSAYGDAPVEGQGPTGTLKADSFSIDERGDVLRFNGSVKVTLYR